MRKIQLDWKLCMQFSGLVKGLPAIKRYLLQNEFIIQPLIPFLRKNANLQGFR